jgi:hypothetical protein
MRIAPADVPPQARQPIINQHSNPGKQKRKQRYTEYLLWLDTQARIK